MNSSDLTELCNTAAYLSTNVQLRVMLWARVAIAVTGLFLFTLLFKVQEKYLAVHENAKILLISHHMWVILQCAASLIAHIYALQRYSSNHSNPCDYLIPATVAILVRGPYSWCTYGQVWALAAMAIERLVATIKYKGYELKANFLAKVAVPVEWLLSVLWLFLAVKNTNWSQLRVHSTVTTSSNGQTVANLLFILAGVEIIAFCTFFFLYFLNKRNKTSLERSATLTEKYQLDENIRSIYIMTPMVLTHFFCFMPQLIAFPIYYKYINPDFTPREYILFTETFTLSPLYCIILPIVLFWRHKTLRKNLRAVLRLNTMVSGANRSDGRGRERINHFEILNQMWNTNLRENRYHNS